MSASGESTGKKLRRHLIAVWSVAAVFVLTMFATRYVEMDVSSVYLAAVMFSAWRGGLGAGLLATALSAVLGAFFFFPPAYVRADKSALRRALCAVVENAIKYTPDEGRIILRARRDEDGGPVAIEVEDTGVGVRAEDLPRIFDRFYRGRAGAGDGAGNLDEQEVPGIGLGLHLARVLVEGMGGSIEASSRVGHGSTFTLRLPVWRDETNDEANVDGGEWATSSVKAPAENLASGAVKREGLPNG